MRSKAYTFCYTHWLDFCYIYVTLFCYTHWLHFFQHFATFFATLLLRSLARLLLYSSATLLLCFLLDFSCTQCLHFCYIHLLRFFARLFMHSMSTLLLHLCYAFCYTFPKPALKLSTENAKQESVHFLLRLHSLPSIDMSTTLPSSTEPAMK